MQLYLRTFRLAALALALSGPAIAQIAILQIQILEGEGAVHAPGSRMLRPLTVVVTDETGRPVEGAAVSFHLPDEGPGGLFLTGLRTEVAVTDARGRAVVRALQANRIPGRFQIRIIAAKEQARAGTVSFQYVAELKSGAASPRTPSPSRSPSATGPSHSRGKWIAAVAALAAGGALAGVFAGRAGSAGPAAAAPPPPTLTIGTPSVSVGKP